MYTPNEFIFLDGLVKAENKNKYEVLIDAYMQRLKIHKDWDWETEI